MYVSGEYHEYVSREKYVERSFGHSFRFDTSSESVLGRSCTKQNENMRIMVELIQVKWKISRMGRDEFHQERAGEGGKRTAKTKR